MHSYRADETERHDPFRKVVERQMCITFGQKRPRTVWGKQITDGNKKATLEKIGGSYVLVRGFS